MAGGVRCSVLAFVDDVVLLAENDQVLVDTAVEFFKHRGMTFNPAKCHVLVKRRIKSAVISIIKTNINIQGRSISHATDLNPFR